jgi:GDPmannose 4,6-dehydratase
MAPSPRTVLVTGALGQDGRLLTERLSAEGHRVVGLVRPARLGEAGAPCPLASVDLGDASAVADLVAGLKPDRIFHVAAAHHASDVPLTADPAVWRAMTTVNTLATTHLIQAILAHAPACRLVYAASSQMYRPNPALPERRIAEDAAFDPPTWYGLTKSWSTEAIRFARAQHGLHGSTAILFNHESPYRPEAFVSRKITLTAARVRLRQADGLRLRNIGARADWFAAADAVEAMLRMAEAEAADDYMVGSGGLSSVRDMVAAAFTAAGLDWTRHVSWDEDTARPTLSADTAKIRARLGWAPRTPIAEEIRRMTLTDLARLGG